MSFLPRVIENVVIWAGADPVSWVALVAFGSVADLLSSL